MRTVLITSQVTFVPGNYSRIIVGLAADPRLVGLVLIDNRSWTYLLQGLALILTLAAPRLGWALVKNSLWRLNRKAQTFELLNKPVHITKNLNSSESMKWLKEMNIDLVINARTRTIFKSDLLSIPRLGSINIHHGLLPDQRGLMCDFWSHFENLASGFSVHTMTVKLDDGDILAVREVVTDKSNYMQSIATGEMAEIQTLIEVLNQIDNSKKISGLPNLKSSATKYRRNPGLIDFLKIRIKGVRI